MNDHKRLGLLARRVILAMLLAVVVYGAFVMWRGFGEIRARLAVYAWWTFAAACGLAFANYLLRFLKWEYYLAVLRIRGVPKGESLLTFLSGFVLTVTPGKVGEVFKSLILLQTQRIPVERTAPIVVAERVTDLIGVIVMIAVGSLQFRGGAIWASCGAALVVVLLVFVGSPRASTAVLDRVERLGGVFGRVAPKLREALVGVRELTSPRRLVWPTLLSIVAWSLEGLALWIILKGFGQEPGVVITGFIYATATLAGALVPVPGGLGVAEKLLETQMDSLAHVPAGIATAAMLLVRFATLWFAVAVGFAALALLRATHPGLRPGAVLEAAATAPIARKDASPAG